MKKIIITGAASGLGAALAKQYAQQGWSVCIADIQQAEGQALAAELEATYGTDCFFQCLNVTNDEQWLALQEIIATKWQGLDALINNAGVGGIGGIEQFPMKDFQWVVDINVMGVVKGCHYFAPLLKTNGGYLINVASMAGLVHWPNVAAYNVSKAAVVALSETLVAELSPYDIKVSVVCPAFFKTNLTETMRSTSGAGIQFAKSQMEKSNITADDIAQLVYKKSLAGKFYILTHLNESMIWRMKRFFPFLYLRKLKQVGQQLKNRLS